MRLHFLIPLVIFCTACYATNSEPFQPSSTESTKIRIDFPDTESFFVYLLSQRQVERAHEFSIVSEMSADEKSVAAQEFCAVTILEGIRNKEDNYRTLIEKICETFSIDKRLTRAMAVEGSSKYGLDPSLVKHLTLWME